MTTLATSEADEAWLKKPRRLHWMALFYPFRSYARPQRLGGTGTLPWLIVALLLGVILVINLNAGGIRSFTADFIADTSVSSSDGGITFQVANDSGLAEPLELGLTILLIVLTIAIPVTAAYFIIRWWTFRWWIEDGGIRTRGGLLNTWSRQVLMSDIVSIERTTDPLRRFLRVTTVTIETSAADQTPANVFLDWLKRADADRLTRMLLFNRGCNPEPAQMLSTSPPRPIDLIAASAFNIQLTRTALSLYAAYSLLLLLAPDRWLPGWLVEAELTIDTEKQGVIGAASSVAGLVLALWLASVLIFVLTFARFRLAHRSGWLQSEGGLIRRRQRWIRTAAIQGLELVESPAQRPAGTATLRMRMLVHGMPEHNQLVLHPSLHRSALPALLEPIVELDHDVRMLLSKGTLNRLPVASRAPFLVSWRTRIAGLAVIAGLIVLSGERGLWWIALLWLAAIAILDAAGYLAWKHAGWHVSDGRWLMARSGRINTTTVIAHVSRIAYLSWSRGVLARHAGPSFTLALSNPHSGEAGLVDRLLVLLRRGTPPSMVTLKHLTADDALALAERSGLGRSLPHDLFDRGATARMDHEAGLDESGRTQGPPLRISAT